MQGEIFNINMSAMNKGLVPAQIEATSEKIAATLSDNSLNLVNI